MNTYLENTFTCHIESEEKEALSFLPQDQWLDFILCD